MCGIAGILTNAIGADGLKIVAEDMIGALAHRGPDGEGIWLDPEAGVALAHRRLAIIDLSAAGHQPMVSSSGRYVISFNGEIYNFRALCTELSALGHAFRGHADTEVLLAAIEQWGVEIAATRSDGMFAFALWDRLERTLTLARDRIGKKPLCYALANNTFTFGSELGALLRNAELDTTIDRDALAELFRYGFISSPRSVLKAVRKIPPGCILRVSRRADGVLVSTETRYWSALTAYEGRNRWNGSYPEALARLDEVLEDAVRLRLESDVPVGAFLSGGIDSSLIVGMMQRVNGGRTRTFTIGFDDREFDEARFAGDVARHLGTRHDEIRINDSDLLHLVPTLASAYDEPFADPSQLPTLLLCQLTRRHVTVALSGDGGDELFGGYDRYQRLQKVLRIRARLSPAVRRGAGRLLRVAADRRIAGLADFLGRRLSSAAGAVPPHQQFAKAADFLIASDKPALYERFMTIWSDPASIVPGARTQWANFFTLSDGHPGGSFEWMMAIDSEWYLPEDIMVKVDRASMSVGLEARAPLLDYRVAELVASLPEGFKVGPGCPKRILRDLAFSLVPRQLLERPKHGFGAPIAKWLRGPLRPWAEMLLSIDALATSGVLNHAPVREKWLEHLSGQCDWSAQLWAVLMFQSWYDELIKGRRSSSARASHFSAQAS